MKVTAEGGDVTGITVHVGRPFAVGNGCSALKLGHTCTIEVRFAPTDHGAVQADLVVESSAGVESAKLKGTGESTVTTPPPTGPAPTTVPPPPTTTPPETREECDVRALGARITYAPTIQMQVDTSETIEVKATTGTPVETTTSGPPDTTAVVSQALRCQVRARLVGNDFTINPQDWQAKSFLGTNEVVWSWIATPNVVGDDLPLNVEVQGLAFDAATSSYLPAGDEFETTANIHVDSKPKSVLTRFNSAVSGVVTHPVFALFVSTGALALVVGWLIRRFRPNSRSGPPPSGAAPEPERDPS
jgi:hypothetical protein